MFHARKALLSTTKNLERFLSTHGNHLEINFENKVLKYNYIWLRDHCRCEKCYNRKTFQIASDINEIALDIKPTDCQKSGDNLKIKWQDGHETVYSLPWLQSLEFGDKSSKKQTVLWNKNSVGNFSDSKVEANEILRKDNIGVTKLLSSILKYGFGFVTGANSTLESTEEIAKRVAFVEKTMFGEMWEVSTDYKYNDTAYTSIPLGVHTDNTYFTEASGLQIFHILSHDGEGGETILVDGFNAAKNLELQHKECYDFLCNNPIESEYIDKDIHYNSIEPVLKVHPYTKELYQIRYNIYDRANLTTINYEDIQQFYKSYKLLGMELNSTENQWIFKLQPGTIVFIDNWRVLHGRTSFTGLRRLTGCYIGRGPWLSKAKAMGCKIY
ncbi:PREDICTED: trimethyllysine dioxygenase, mitochondrial [Nicrophorus vespilloides]|uniref:Trimethyllysine dioxygenase, mitochondrial n=1 Tax=Nicrophorus vespilloides TaxID=110193 RepID=A0ABM1M530_NICVS|nr:PREDICTED: trimethyllysine dioxygenase, mitochondrial [Nicrophorus vespilloides]